MAQAKAKRRNEYEETPDYGSAFHRKENTGNQPQFTGTGLLSDETLDAIKAAGGQFEVAAWGRRAKSGAKYLRLHIEAPYNGGDESDSDDDDDEDDDLPF